MDPIIIILSIVCICLLFHNTYLQISRNDIIRIANNRAAMIDDLDSKLLEYKDALKKDLFPTPKN